MESGHLGIRIAEKAHREGQDAYLMGRRITQVPYNPKAPVNSDEWLKHQNWTNGWRFSWFTHGCKNPTSGIIRNPGGRYESFHGVPPARVRKVNYRDPRPGEKLIKIGRLKELVYHPEPPSQRAKSNYVHKFGDYGDGKFVNRQPILAVSQDGKQLYIINDDSDPVFGERGIVG